MQAVPDRKGLLGNGAAIQLRNRRPSAGKVSGKRRQTSCSCSSLLLQPAAAAAVAAAAAAAAKTVAFVPLFAPVSASSPAFRGLARSYLHHFHWQRGVFDNFVQTLCGSG